MSDTQARIDDLVKQNEVLLFMKGSASFPMCGFSGRAIQILKACGVDPKAVKTVNVRRLLKQSMCWTMLKFAMASRNTATGLPFLSCM
ncbi:MAG: Glutaredoxin-4 [Pseudomonadota bacterium]